MDREPVDGLVGGGRGGARDGEHALVGLGELVRRGDAAVEVAADHGDHAGGQVAEAVRELGLVARAEVLPAERAVLAEGDGAHEVVAERVDAEGVGDGLRHDARELRLRHLLAADEQPAVAEDTAGRLLAERHEHGRPDDRVEAEDVLAHEVRRGPTAAEPLVVDAVADGRDVVHQRLEPHVDHVALVPRDRDAPVEAGARDRQVLEAPADEREDLVARALGLDEVGALLVEREQPLAEVAHAEEVVLLLEQLDGLRMDGADELALERTRALEEVGGLLVLLAADAVVALVLARVDEPGVVEALQEDLDALLVAGVRGADEVVVGDVDGLEQRLPALGDEAVGAGLGGGVVRRGGAEDLLPVLVGAREEPGVVAALAVPAGEHVGGDLGVRVPDVRDVVHVEDRRGDVEGLAAGHGLHPNDRRERSRPCDRGSGGGQDRWRSAGPSYSESGRISELDARCSTTCAVQPTTRAATNSGVKARVSKPRSA